MANNDKMEFKGTVLKALKGAKFEVSLDDFQDQKTVICTLNGKLRMNNIRVIEGDKVTVLISPYDLNAGIIIWRDK